MSELSKEDLEVLARLVKDDEEREKIPQSERRPVKHPKKYIYPIGMKDNGDLKTQEEVNNTLKKVGLR